MQRENPPAQPQTPLFGSEHPTQNISGSVFRPKNQNDHTMAGIKRLRGLSNNLENSNSIQSPPKDNNKLLENESPSIFSLG